MTEYDAPALPQERLDAALRAFDDAAHALIGPRFQVRIAPDGRRIVMTAPSVYDEMTAEMAGRQGTAFGGVARSLPPLWVDGVDFFREVDGEVAAWAPGELGGTPARLNYLLGWAWTPLDVVQLDTYSAYLMRWVSLASELIEGRGAFPLAAPCPKCQASEVVHVDNAGEHVRKPALEVSMRGAECHVCGEVWEPRNLTLLAAALRCAPLAGVVSSPSCLPSS
ncbi:hypothetical protein QNA23_10920 [Rhodococcus erythropolis]|uniref:DUF7341 domain-containing protein n=1 Tax=Rhodococcus erythropolis TaxID=1833 RepID=UPI0024B987FB|nr:hypothetical protein [Rhodococcus erythropolis]MDJ0403995.1 hypothetical protein [Rhodococcus erythropolis]